MANVSNAIELVDLNDSVDKDIKFIYTFAKTNGLDEYSSVSEIREKIRNDKKLNSIPSKKSYINKLNRFSFFDPSNVKYKKSEDAYDILSLLTLIKNEIITYLNNKKTDFSKQNILRRRVSPPLEAFKSVGHNNLDIKPTGRDYGLLFE
ncbi:hypothetical protein C3729_12975 [Cloacibacterium normanense]|uniref:Uncharacterized protein n=1 Tax=Cloacibacterium normanense TaxID=237258 RepID=A0A2S7I1S5_9FLAO|nr:hypothetical protein [Cloacibacterium normanense]PPZ90524.1 hypothetical protein C3729_12975 [Cloacibacterium normanense]